MVFLQITGNIPPALIVSPKSTDFISPQHWTSSRVQKASLHSTDDISHSTENWTKLDFQ